jgi:hypothetical protein
VQVDGSDESQHPSSEGEPDHPEVSGFSAQSTQPATGLSLALSALHERCLAPSRGKLAVLLGCLLAGLLSLSVAGRISIGLDQAVALPKDSYLQTYYQCALTQCTELLTLCLRLCVMMSASSIVRCTGAQRRSSGLIAGLAAVDTCSPHHRVPCRLAVCVQGRDALRARRPARHVRGAEHEHC